MIRRMKIESLLIKPDGLADIRFVAILLITGFQRISEVDQDR